MSAARETADAIRRAWPHEASIGLILGTGAAAVGEAFAPECRHPFGELPHLLPTTAVGHPGKFLGGLVGPHRIAILQGRVHLYEGHSPDRIAFPIQVLYALGVRTLIVTNASGGLNPHYRCGDLVVIDDLLDLTFPPLLPLPLDGGGDSPPRSSRATPSLLPLPLDREGGRGVGAARHQDPLFSSNLTGAACTHARRANITAHRGTYVGVLGPNYETRAEYRFLRRIADIVGMSTVHEVRAANDLGMEVLGLSVVSNECCPDRPAKTTGELVVRAVEEAADRLATLIVTICQNL